MIVVDYLAAVPNAGAKRGGPSIEQVAVVAVFVRVKFQIGIIPFLVSEEISDPQNRRRSFGQKLLSVVCPPVEWLADRPEWNRNPPGFHSNSLTRDRISALESLELRVSVRNGWKTDISDWLACRLEVKNGPSLPVKIPRNTVGPWLPAAGVFHRRLRYARRHPGSNCAPPDGIARLRHALFKDFDGATPGCAVGVYRGGEIIFSKGYGLADVQAGVPITGRTVFDVASLSKQFTAFAIALLAQEGRVSLDAEVRTYVPELPWLGHPITVRHLIHHISGLREYSALLELGGWRIDDPLSKSEVLALLKRQRGLNFKPGERHEYNSTNYLLMAMIVERVSGLSFQQFTEQRIFRPLGMTSTLVRYPGDPVPSRAVNYTGKADGNFAPNGVWDRAYGAGVVNVHTSIEDLAKWDRNFFHPLVGDPALIRTLYSPTTLNSGQRTAYAYGLDLGTHRGMRAISHGGMGGGTFHLLRLPEQKLSVAALCNRYSLGVGAPDTWTLARDVADTFLAQEGGADREMKALPPLKRQPNRTIWRDMRGAIGRRVGLPSSSSWRRISWWRSRAERLTHWFRWDPACFAAQMGQPPIPSTVRAAGYSPTKRFLLISRQLAIAGPNGRHRQPSSGMLLGGSAVPKFRIVGRCCSPVTG